jgi:hypothetical protein
LFLGCGSFCRNASFILEKLKSLSDIELELEKEQESGLMAQLQRHQLNLAKQSLKTKIKCKMGELLPFMLYYFFYENCS